jgi:hypothetical protein
MQQLFDSISIQVAKKGLSWLYLQMPASTQEKYSELAT